MSSRFSGMSSTAKITPGASILAELKADADKSRVACELSTADSSAGKALFSAG